MGAQGSLIIYVIIIWYYARYMNNLDHRLRRARRGGRLMATPAKGTGGLFSAGSQKGFNSQLKKVYTWYTGGFLHLHRRARHPGADGPAAELDRLPVPARHDRSLRRHRRDEPDLRRRRVLRRGPARAGAVQRHGDRRGLDVRGVVHRHGGHAVPAGLRRPGVHPGLDRRLRAWWRCSWRRTCASSASSPFPTSSARATAATSRASSASSPRSCARSPTWWRRSTAWASSRRA